MRPAHFLLATLLMLASRSMVAQPAQVDTAARRRAMDKIAFLVGDWAGEATAFVAGGQQMRMWQSEWVRPKLKGQILAVEGMGRRLLAGGPADTLFNAWATIEWSPDKGYMMKSTTLDGRSGEFPLTVTDSGFTWGIELPAGARVRYTMRLTTSGEWSEFGEYTRDGSQWLPVMNMRLKRTQSPLRP
jgi:hypothetical protein